MVGQALASPAFETVVFGDLLAVGISHHHLSANTYPDDVPGTKTQQLLRVALHFFVRHD
jgi:hypothetical protein